MSRKVLRSVAVGVMVLSAAIAVQTSALATPEDLKYVALGDSYSAGQFIGGDANLVREPIDGGLGDEGGDYCGRSKSSYPQQLAATVLANYEFIDRTCGGATIDYRGLAVGGIMTPQKGFGGPPYIPVDAAGVPQFTPTPRPAQIDSLDSTVDLVTVGVGGNQYNIGAIVGKCAALGGGDGTIGHPCQDYYEGTWVGHEDLMGKKEDLIDGYRLMLAEIARRVDHNNVFFLGYPTLFPDTVAGIATCDSGLDENLTIQKADLPFIQRQFTLVDAIIKEMVEAAGYHYVDLAESTKLKHVCREGDAKWMFGLHAHYEFNEELDGYKPALFPDGQDDAPFTPGFNAWIQGALAHGTGVFRGNETLTTFHPNLRGTQNQALQATNAFIGAGVPHLELG